MRGRILAIKCALIRVHPIVLARARKASSLSFSFSRILFFYSVIYSGAPALIYISLNQCYYLALPGAYFQQHTAVHISWSFAIECCSGQEGYRDCRWLQIFAFVGHQLSRIHLCGCMLQGISISSTIVNIRISALI